MSQKRFSPEFRDEAVRQVTEKGHSVQEVAARLGVSSHSLYKWVKAVRPDKDEQNGTRHAWRNPFSESRRIVVLLIGAERIE